MLKVIDILNKYNFEITCNFKSVCIVSAYRDKKQNSIKDFLFLKDIFYLMNIKNNIFIKRNEIIIKEL